MTRTKNDRGNFVPPPGWVAPRKGTMWMEAQKKHKEEKAAKRKANAEAKAAKAALKAATKKVWTYKYNYIL